MTRPGKATGARVEIVGAAVAWPLPTDRPRKGANAPVRTGRAARTRVGHHMSRERRLDNLGRMVLVLNRAAGVVTVADELRLRGADVDIVRRYASPVGRRVAQVYRASAETEPRQIGVAVIGINIGPAFGYAEADRDLIGSVIDGYETKSPVRARLLDLIAERAW